MNSAVYYKLQGPFADRCHFVAKLAGYCLLSVGINYWKLLVTRIRRVFMNVGLTMHLSLFFLNK